MKQHMSFKQGFSVQIGRPTLIMESGQVRFGGRFGLEIFDKKGRRINVLDFLNGITNEGLTDLLQAYFKDGVASPAWYFGLIAGTGTLNAADTLASYAGWTEFTDYTGDRKAWMPEDAAAREIGNITTSDFAITGSGTLKGAFLASVDTGTAGILWSTGLFNTNQPVENGNTIKLSYVLSG